MMFVWFLVLRQAGSVWNQNSRSGQKLQTLNKSQFLIEFHFIYRSNLKSVERRKYFFT